MLDQKPINNFQYKARRILILGQTGMGKTTCALRLIHLLPAKIVFVYDWQGGELAERLGARCTADRAELGRLIEKGERNICYDPGDNLDDEQQEADFAWWCDMALEVSGQLTGRKLAVIDEGQDLMSTQKIPKPLRRLLARGRRREVDTIILAESANAIHGKGRNQVSELFCFRCVDPNALAYPESLGMDGEQVKTLPEGSFIHRNPAGKIMKLAMWSKNANPDESPPTKEN